MIASPYTGIETKGNRRLSIVAAVNEFPAWFDGKEKLCEHRKPGLFKSIVWHGLGRAIKGFKMLWQTASLNATPLDKTTIKTKPRLFSNIIKDRMHSTPTKIKFLGLDTDSNSL